MTAPPIDTLLTNALLPDGGRGEIAIVGGRITGIGAPTGAAAAETVDLEGDLVLPAMVDGHMHLDKTLLGLPWMPHAAQPHRMSRIETDKRVLPGLALSTEERAANLIRQYVGHGTAHIRTHVDVDLEGKLTRIWLVGSDQVNPPNYREKLSNIPRIRCLEGPFNGQKGDFKERSYSTHFDAKKTTLSA